MRDYGKLMAEIIYFLFRALVLMLLWNALFPALVGAARMNYLQALGVTLLWYVCFVRVLKSLERREG